MFVADGHVKVTVVVIVRPCQGIRAAEPEGRDLGERWRERIPVVEVDVVLVGVGEVAVANGHIQVPVVVHVTPSQRVGVSSAEGRSFREARTLVVQIEEARARLPVTDRQIEVAVIVGISPCYHCRVAGAELGLANEVAVAVVDVQVVLLGAVESAVSDGQVHVAVAIEVGPGHGVRLAQAEPLLFMESAASVVDEQLVLLTRIRSEDAITDGQVQVAVVVEVGPGHTDRACNSERHPWCKVRRAIVDVQGVRR